LRKSQDNSIVVTDAPHLASPTLLHGCGIYFPLLDQEGVTSLISNIHNLQTLDTLVRLSSLPYNHTELLAPCDGTIPLLDRLTTNLQLDNKKYLNKTLVIIANFASCEETRTVLVRKTLIESLVVCLTQDDPIIKTLLSVIFTSLRSTYITSLDSYHDQLQVL